MQQPYGYTGREFDAESGLYYYRARSYDPETGMFVQSDPIGFGGGALGVYSYTQDSPFYATDPTGLSQALLNRGMSNVSSSGGTMARTSIFQGVANLGGNIISKLLLISASPAYAPEATTKPNLCPAAIHVPLQNMINALKKIPGCSGTLSPEQNLRQMQFASREIMLRSLINNACYQGGDPTHRKAIADKWKAMRQCNALITSGRGLSKGRK